MERKDWWASRTIWFNLLYLIVVLAGMWGYGEWAPSGEERELLESLAIVINAFVNLLLRKLTTAPI